MDVFAIEALVHELAGRLAGARIDKIHQPEAEVLILRLWARREEVRLLLSAAPGRARCHLTVAAPPNPPAPPRFCQLLRARLAGVVAFEQVPEERILRLRCRGSDGGEYSVVAELFGGHPDLVLVDGTGTIVDALRRTTAGGRENLPGRPYRSPAAPSRIPLHQADLHLPPEASADSFEKWLLARVAPMSSLVARDLAAGVAQGKAPAEVLDCLRILREDGDLRPAVGLLDGRPVLVAFAPFYLHLEAIRPFAGISEAADYFYSLPAVTGGGERRQLQAVLRRESERLMSRRRRLEEEQTALAAREAGKHFGDLLMANLHQVQRGMAGVTLDDLFQDPPVPVHIPLDPLLTPVENAERYFQRCRKGRKGREHLHRRLLETAAEFAWIEGAALALEEAESAIEVELVRRELEEARVVAPPAARTPRPRPAAMAAVNRAVSPGGYVLVWGKTNGGNDRVSRELTGPGDLWFHAHRLPGCHLVLQRQGRKEEVPERDLLFAAALAAGYSKGKKAAKVEVMIAEGRHVGRPRGARPGLVTVDQYRTVVVSPLRLSGGAETFPD